MEEDQRWLAENEMNWQVNRFGSLSRSSDNCSEPNRSTSTSVYEDADSNKNDDHQPSSLDRMRSKIFFFFFKFLCRNLID